MNEMKKAANVLLLLVLLWCGAIIGAPFMALCGGLAGSLSIFFYKFFGVICHQFESHTFHIDGHPFGVCIRCTAIYSGFFLGVLSMRFLNAVQSYRINPRILLLIVSFPVFIDGMLSFTGWYAPTTAARLLTGGIFGFGVSLIIYNSLVEIIFALMNSTTINYESTSR